MKLPEFFVVEVDGSLVAGTDDADEALDIAWETGGSRIVVPKKYARFQMAPNVLTGGRWNKTIDKLTDIAPMMHGNVGPTDMETWHKNAWLPHIMSRAKIQMIKETRAQFGLSLREAKDFIDWAVDQPTMPA